MLLEKDVYPQSSISLFFYFNIHLKKKKNTKEVLKSSTFLFLFVQNTLT